MQASSLRYCVTTFLSTPPGYTKKQPQPRLFLYTGESVRFNKNAHCFAVEPSRLTLRFRCKHLRFAIASRRSFRLPPGTPKNNRNRGCFVLFSGESVRFNKNAHCSAVEPSGWRFTFDASIFVTLFRRFAPSDSPRVHQKTTATAVVLFYFRGSPCVLIKTHTAPQLNPPAGASLSMQASSLRYFVALLLPTPPGYTSGIAIKSLCHNYVCLLANIISLWRKPKFHRRRRFHSL